MSEDEHWLCVDSRYDHFNSWDRVIGYGFLRGWHDDWPDICLGVVVHPEYRGLGYGEKICRFLLEVGRKRGLQRIRLHVWPGNKTALRLYRKLGFQFDGKIRNNGELIGLLHL